MAESKGPNKALQARNKATADLIAAHQDEWYGLVEKHATALGIVYSRPLTAEQRAERDIAAMLEKYPHLAEKFGGGTSEATIAQGIRAAG